MRDIDLWHRGQDAIAQGALTNSKHPKSHVFGVYPKYIQYGKGACLVDHSGKTYIDYICGLGTNILGYGNTKLSNELKNHIGIGFSHSLPTHFEVAAAEKLKEIFPWASAVKFLKTGTEACMAAIKIARAATGRMKVLSDGYHGWSDSFVSLTPPAVGVWPQQGVSKLQYLSEIDDKTAAVIVEPIIIDDSNQRINWLNLLRKRCDETGAMLIFDEVITGIRYRQFSASRAFNIYPDLLIVGKAIANGLPLSAILGQPKVMHNPDYFVSSTYASEVLSLIACRFTVELIQKSQEYNNEMVWNAGASFKEQFNAIEPDMVRINGYNTRGIFEGPEATVAAFFQEACKSGILFCKSWFYNADLIRYDSIVLNTCRDILARFKNQGIPPLEGDMPISPFALKVRQQ